MPTSKRRAELWLGYHRHVATIWARRLNRVEELRMRQAASEEDVETVRLVLLKASLMEELAKLDLEDAEGATQ